MRELPLNFKRIGYQDSRRASGEHVCFLVDDHWDDFGYKTLFHLIYLNRQGLRQELGLLKIMKRGMAIGRVQVKESFRKLDKTHASLGTDQKFYENVVALGPETAREVFESLRDAAWDEDIRNRFREDAAFTTSLMRGLRNADIRKFADIAHDRATLTPYRFEYTFPNSEAPGLLFQVTPHVLPPTNIHIIIGRNGVGKTWLIKSLISLLCDGESVNSKSGRLAFTSPGDAEDGDGTFANLINVAFSAFDEVEFPASQKGTKTGIQLSYIGLRRPIKTLKSLSEKTKGIRSSDSKSTQKTQLKSLGELATEFLNSLLICLRSSKKDLWLSTMAILESDPIFGSMCLRELAACDEEGLTKRAKLLFLSASSGHKIVLLSLTRLVELVEERTLVLVDEPEAHLHPPLQSSFIRALSSLLTVRNGLAILATHSPVMLQEVPRDCVWLLFREGVNTSSQRPQIETFAENLGVLTREVFRLEITQSGYHTLLMTVVKSSESIEDLFARFREHLGTEGRAVARSLFRHRQVSIVGESE
jgi:ABC-type transport system involved in cytochrome c biogenesis ATPase subunit